MFDKAKSDYRQEKLKYYANLLINYTTTKFSIDFYKEGIIESISKFSVEHIIALKEIYNKHFEIDDNKKSDFEEQENLCEDMAKNIWNICVQTLFSNGFLIKGFWGGYTISNYGIRCLELIEMYN